VVRREKRLSTLQLLFDHHVDEKKLDRMNKDVEDQAP